MTWDPSAWSTKHCVADLHQEIENLARIFNVSDPYASDPYANSEPEFYYYQHATPPQTIRETELLLCIDKLQTTLMQQNQYILQLKRTIEQQQRAVEISQTAERYLRRQLKTSTPFRRTRARSASPKSQPRLEEPQMPQWITSNTDRLIAEMNFPTNADDPHLDNANANRDQILAIKPKGTQLARMHSTSGFGSVTLDGSDQFRPSNMTSFPAHQRNALTIPMVMGGSPMQAPPLSRPPPVNMTPPLSRPPPVNMTPPVSLAPPVPPVSLAPHGPPMSLAPHGPPMSLAPHGPPVSLAPQASPVATRRPVVTGPLVGLQTDSGRRASSSVLGTPRCGEENSRRMSSSPVVDLLGGRLGPPSVPLRRQHSEGGCMTPKSGIVKSAPMSPWGGAAERCRQRLMSPGGGGSSPVAVGDIDAKLSCLRDLIVAARRRCV